MHQINYAQYLPTPFHTLPLQPAKRPNFFHFIGTNLPDWYSLKDDARQFLTPGWTESHFGRGWMRFNGDYGSARRAYEWFTGERNYIVHHFDTTNSEPVLLRTNCSLCSPGAQEANWPYLAVVPPHVPHIFPSHLFSEYPIASIQCVPQIPLPDSLGAYFYTTGNNGLPVNTRNGVISTESVSIFIRRLHHGVKQRDVERLLEDKGVPAMRVDLNPEKGKNKTGLAFYSSSAEAQRACRRLNGELHMGMKLDVRLDKDTQAVSLAQPLVIDGSTPQGHL